MNSVSSKQSLLAANSLDALYPVLDANRMTAGWHKKRPSLWNEPRTAYRPLHWSYDVGVAALDQAGRWLDVELAERRNLLLFNPVDDNDYDTVRTLVAAFQMIKPGEYARAHRHSPNALRLVLEANEGCFTVVDGVELPMSAGDLLLTPGNAWHSHFNRGETNAYWIDILDVPLVHRLEPMFVEHLPGGEQSIASSPAEHPFYFPRAAITQGLDAVAPIGGVSSFVADSLASMRTMQIAFHRFAERSTLGPDRNTASRILCLMEGAGRASVGSDRFDLGRGDVVAVPSWHPYELEADAGALFVEVSDEPVLRALGFYREHRRAA